MIIMLYAIAVLALINIIVTIKFNLGRKINSDSLDTANNQTSNDSNIYCPYCGAKQPDNAVLYTRWERVEAVVNEIYDMESKGFQGITSSQALSLLISKKNELCYYKCLVCNKHYKAIKCHTKTETFYETARIN